MDGAGASVQSPNFESDWNISGLPSVRCYMSRGRHYPIHEARGGGPKSVHQLALLIQPSSRLIQTEKTTDLSSSREVDSKNIIRIIFGEIYKKLDLPPNDHHTFSTIRVLVHVMCVTCIDTQFTSALKA